MIVVVVVVVERYVELTVTKREPTTNHMICS